MSERTLTLQIRLNLQTILIMVLIMHGLFLSTKRLKDFGTVAPGIVEDDARKIEPIKLLNIRTVGKKDGVKKNLLYLGKEPTIGHQIPKPKSVQAPKQLSLRDLTDTKPTFEPKSAQTKQVRPGTRPTAFPEKKAIEAIALRGSQIHKFSSSQASNAAALTGDPRAAALANSDVLVKLEVPEGVSESELNKYELMFYGFQKRTATNYINSLFNELDKFERSHPHLNFPMTENKQVMTGRLVYDEKGNLKQIKMIRWSNQEKLQEFFEHVLKNMDTLHNPPHILWEKTGEFAIFFSLQVNA